MSPLRLIRGKGEPDDRDEQIRVLHALANKNEATLGAIRSRLARLKEAADDAALTGQLIEPERVQDEIGKAYLIATRHPSARDGFPAVRL